MTRPEKARAAIPRWLSDPGNLLRLSFPPYHFTPYHTFSHKPSLREMFGLRISAVIRYLEIPPMNIVTGVVMRELHGK